MTRGDLGGGRTEGTANFLEVDVGLDVINVFSVFRTFPNRPLYNFDIALTLKEVRGYIAQGEYFEQRLDTALHFLQKRGLVIRASDGRYYLTYEGKNVREINVG